MSDEVRVLLVRHGQSEWNAAGRWQGQADPPLSELGRIQAREAARALGTVDAIWSSDLQRASETALIIAHDLGIGPVVIEADLRERDAGAYSGLTRDEIEELFPGYLAERRPPPGWEAQDALVARALRALRRIAAEVPGGDVVAITHGGVIYAVEGHLGVDHQRIANTGGRWVTVTADGSVPMRLGERLLLSDPGDTTVPAQL
ncbi:MAG: histidine phosphatase family protein [Acidimicrobiia bacterium]